MYSFVIWCLLRQIIISITTVSSSSVDLYQIEGKIIFPIRGDGIHHIRILVDEGQYVGIPRIDGTFVITGISSGSYIVSVISPIYIFKSIRVDINTKGKIRAREVDFIQPDKIVPLKYPLHFEVQEHKNYFQKRESYKWTDLILNPTFLVIIVGVPLFLFIIKTMPQGEEFQPMLQQTQDIFQPNLQMPDITDLFIRLFGAPQRRRSVNQDSNTQNATTSAGTSAKINSKRKHKRKS
ncbi:hypothetical protein I4U23_019983 [Adineta vaga]|nr:hypothetical protein I4U23_019983 [Adineta vaga]